MAITAGSNGNAYGFISYSDVTGGNVNFVWASGATGARPSSPATGQVFYDTTLHKPIWYSGSNWTDATGATV